MIDLRRVLLLALLLAATGCEGGPTSDWPAEGSKGGDDDSAGPRMDAGSSASFDAGTVGETPTEGECATDGGDAGCEPRDF